MKLLFKYNCLKKKTKKHVRIHRDFEVMYMETVSNTVHVKSTYYQVLQYTLRYFIFIFLIETVRK